MAKNPKITTAGNVKHLTVQEIADFKAAVQERDSLLETNERLRKTIKFLEVDIETQCLGLALLEKTGVIDREDFDNVLSFISENLKNSRGLRG